MKISIQNNSVLFGKSLVASCNVKRKTGELEECDIYELDKKEDFDYFLKLKNNPDWANGKYVTITNNLFLSPYSSKRANMYAIEDKFGSCLGYVRTISVDDCEKNEQIEFLETCPTLSSNNKKRQVKYVGQSLVAFVVGMAKRENKQSVYVPIVAQSARKFYQKKCYFKNDTAFKNCGVVLENSNYDKLLKKHRKNTHSAITYYV